MDGIHHLAPSESRTVVNVGAPNNSDLQIPDTAPLFLHPPTRPRTQAVAESSDKYSVVTERPATWPDENDPAFLSDEDVAFSYSSSSSSSLSPNSEAIHTTFNPQETSPTKKTGTTPEVQQLQAQAQAVNVAKSDSKPSPDLESLSLAGMWEDATRYRPESWRPEVYGLEKAADVEK